MVGHPPRGLVGQVKAESPHRSDWLRDGTGNANECQAVGFLHLLRTMWKFLFSPGCRKDRNKQRESPIPGLEVMTEPTPGACRPQKGLQRVFSKDF